MPAHCARGGATTSLCQIEASAGVCGSCAQVAKDTGEKSQLGSVQASEVP